MSEETKKPVSLVRKLSNVMGAVERVAKNGVNAFHKYSYATEADITQAVRGALSEQGVMMVPTVENIEWAEITTGAGKKERLCTAHFLFTLLDSDSDSKIEFRNIGQGQDAGDKAFYKAATGATKYALLKLFLIPTGDDPENEKAPVDVPRPAGVEALKASVAGVKAEPPKETKPRTHQDITMANFGSGAGKKLSELDDNSVKFYRGACQKTLADETKSKWHAGEILRLAALNEELRYRGLPV